MEQRAATVATASHQLGVVMDVLQAISNGGNLLGRQVEGVATGTPLGDAINMDACAVLDATVCASFLLYVLMWRVIPMAGIVSCCPAFPHGLRGFFVSHPTPQNLAVCSTLMNNTFSHGLYYATSMFFYAAQGAVNCVPGMADGPGADVEAWPAFKSQYASAMSLENPLYRNISGILADNLHKQAGAYVTSSVSDITLVSILFAVAFAFVSFSISIPAAHGIVDRVKATQAIVLLFPNDVLESVPGLRAEIHAIILQERANNTDVLEPMSPKHSQKKLIGRMGRPTMLKNTKQGASAIGRALRSFASSFRLGRPGDTAR